RRHTIYWRDWSSDVCSSDLNLRGKDLGARIRFETVGSGGSTDQFASLSQDQELIAGQGNGRGPHRIIFPANLPRFQFHATQGRLKARIGPTIHSVEESITANTGRVM